MRSARASRSAAGAEPPCRRRRPPSFPHLQERDARDHGAGHRSGPDPRRGEGRGDRVRGHGGPVCVLSCDHRRWRDQPGSAAARLSDGGNGAPAAGSRPGGATPNLGNMPLALYRPGAAEVPASGWASREVVVVQPLPRADESHTRVSTPAPPPGFAFEGRIDARTYTLICYDSTVVRPAKSSTLLALVGKSGSPSAQDWPLASSATGKDANTRSPCAAGRS